MNSMDKKRYFLVIVSALIQGLLLGIYTVVKSGPLRCMPLSIIFLVPFAFWLSQEHWGRRLANMLLGLTGILLIFWLYRLWSLYTPDGNFYFVPSQNSDLIRLSLAIFFLIPFFQCRIAAWSWQFPYSEIFFQFCRNVFLLFQSAIVIAVFWGLVVTAGLLFDIVGIGNVPNLIFNPITAVPLSSLTIAISISVAIKHPGIDSLGRWILSVLSWLLPFFSVLSVIFILCLPFSGLQTLWSTGQSGTLMLLLQFGTIILANAAWLDGSKQVFTNKYINFLAQLSLLCLPVYAGLCLFSVWLRVEQYGLSTDRIQALFLAAVTGIWGLGYAIAVIFRKWPASIGKVNTACVAFMVLLVALMNSPILDPYRLAAYNQADRLHSGKIAPDDFDYLYTRFNLGRYGSHVLAELSKENSEEVKNGVNAAMSIDPDEYLNYTLNNIPPARIRREIISGAKIYPEGQNLTEEQINFFVAEWGRTFYDVFNAGDIAFVFADVEKGFHDVIIFTRDEGAVYTLEGDNPKLSGTFKGEFTPENLKVVTEEPRFLELNINGKNYQVMR